MERSDARKRLNERANSEPLDLDALEALAEAATIPGTRDYLVTRWGEVISKVNWRGGHTRTLTQHPNSNGYPRVRVVMDDGTRKTLLVHTLVARAFLPEPEPGMQVCHIDGDKTNNDVTNLRWGTAADNAADREKHGRTARGERNGYSHLTAADVRRIRQLRKAGISRSEVAQEYGIHYQTVTNITSGKSWGHVS